MLNDEGKEIKMGSRKYDCTQNSQIKSFATCKSTTRSKTKAGIEWELEDILETNLLQNGECAAK